VRGEDRGSRQRANEKKGLLDRKISPQKRGLSNFGGIWSQEAKAKKEEEKRARNVAPPGGVQMKSLKKMRTQ